MEIKTDNQVSIENNPLWMPRGSVRALLILLLTYTACLMTGFQIPVPKELWTLVSMGIAFYTGSKMASRN